MKQLSCALIVVMAMFILAHCVFADTVQPMVRVVGDGTNKTAVRISQ